MTVAGDTKSNQPEMHDETEIGRDQECNCQGTHGADQQPDQDRDPERDLQQFAAIMALGGARVLLRRRDAPSDQDAPKTVGGEDGPSPGQMREAESA